ncbi:hypothetical protein V2S66_30735 [Streptomyces sp. V4-01]|uniref:Asp23/Gls24 family envelope stress response protein n=1 Tax=Actinacidiphila polyblastidii TaxID=3110430 RepID=A0ABU7PKL6_9ACTN|nr:hypothetical protein [Streptomyces sp. V4-01]
MTADAAGVARAAASATLAVPGVVGLQPSLGQSLAAAAGRVGHSRGSRPAAPAKGVHAERTPGSGAWRVEVRCVLDGEHRALDTARRVRESVRSAVVSHTARHGAAGPVTVLVTVTRITGR